MSGASGAVYQPTTVTYDSNDANERISNQRSQERRWSERPVSYLTQAARRRRPCAPCRPSRRTLPTLYCTSSAACLAVGLTLIIHALIDNTFFVGVIIGGVIAIAAGLVLAGLYVRARRRCKEGTHNHNLAAVGREGAVEAPLHVNNPSTDLLVAQAQYAAPDPEQTQLMGKEAVDCADPRILLRPLSAPNYDET